MPWSFPGNIPKPAKNWSEGEQKRCIAAANAALRSGKTEQEAIFACIHAAKKSYKQEEGLTEAQVEFYEEERIAAEQRFSTIATLYTTGTITLNDFQLRMQEELKTYYIRLALIGREGAELSEWDIRDMVGALALQYEYLEGFVEDLRKAEESPDIVMSDRYTLWRVSLYSLAWDRLLRHVLPEWLVDLLPALPGVDCLGGAACGCQLAWDVHEDEGIVEVWWLLDPFKEHCVNCLSYAMEWSPLTLEIPTEVVEF